jgi:hypothetical protein
MVSDRSSSRIREFQNSTQHRKNQEKNVELLLGSLRDSLNYSILTVVLLLKH